MNTKVESNARNLGRSIGMAMLVSMLFFYAIHVFGSWQVENYHPDPDTTSTVLLHNTCAILNTTHTLRPNTDVSTMGEGIDGIKLSGSFMNFFDGHITALLMLSVILTGLIFIFRKKIHRNRQANVI